MKTFIVFLAFIIVFVSFSVYADDSNNYVRLQKYLKALAEECAAGGALMADYDASFREWHYVINDADARKYADFTSGSFRSNLYPLSRGNVSVVSAKRFRNESNNECIRVEVKWAAAPGYRLIRLPFLFSPAEITKTAIYEVK